MNEKKKTVKHVLVLDEDALFILKNWFLCFNECKKKPNIITLLNYFLLLASGQETRKPIGKTFNMFYLFWKAYSKEVE